MTTIVHSTVYNKGTSHILSITRAALHQNIHLENNIL